MKTKLLSLLAAAVGLVGILRPGSADAQTNFSVAMVGVQVVPTNTSPALGTGTLTLNVGSTTTITYFITYSGLVGDFTAAHIHGPAGEGTNTGFIFTLSNFADGTHAGMLTGTTAALMPQQVTNLQSGLNYADIHTTIFPGGEIRSQIVGPITNSWINSSSGLWSNAANWLVGSPSVNHDIELITNANTKTVFMTGSVAAATLVIRNLTVGAPAVQTNSLLISNQTFRILNGLGLAGGGALLLQAGTTQVVAGVSGGGFVVDGRVTLTNGSSIVASNVSTIVGNTDSGSLTVFGGTILTSNLIVGATAGSRGTFTTLGGTVALKGPMVFGDGTGSVWVTGGQFVITNAPASVGAGTGLVVDGVVVLTNGGSIVVSNGNTVVGNTGSGSLTVFGGSMAVSNLTVGNLAGAVGALTIAGGTNIQSSSLTVGNSAVATGTVWVTGSTARLVVTNSSTFIGFSGVGQMTVSNGTVLAQILRVGNGAGSQGTLTMVGGSIANSSALIVGGNAGSTGTVWLTGGSLAGGNSSAGIGGSGVGRMTVSNGTFNAFAMSLGVGGTGAQGTLTVAGGTTTVNFNVLLGSDACTGTGTVIVAGGSLFVTNSFGNGVLGVRSGTLTLSGGTLKVDKFVMTNACAHFARTGGTLTYGTAVLDPNRDDDGDVMPNGWEQQYGLDPLDPSDANIDSDCDGVSNLQEYLNATDPIIAPWAKDGFHNFCSVTTGGEGGTVLTATNAIDFISAVAQTGPFVVKVKGVINLGGGTIPVSANKTILGLGTNATLIGDLKMNNGSNLVIRNLSFTNPGSLGEGDGLTIQHSHHIWVDHCTFYDCADGEFDMTHAVDYATVSRCKFYYTFDSGHNLTCLIGHDDGNAAEDSGKFHITFHHNWWSAMCTARMPRVRFGRIHSYNDYFNVIVPDVFTNGACVQAGLESQVLLEKNYFENVNTPWEKLFSIGTTAKIYALSNALVNVTDQFDPGTDSVFKPPYIYTLDDTNVVPGAVTNYAGAGQLGPGGDPFALWQSVYFGCTNCPEASATADPDGDGMDNNAEFLTGTDPADSASMFRIASVLKEANDIRVTWMTGIGQTNALERTAGASGSFSNDFAAIFSVTNTTGTTTNFLDMGAATNMPALYYRVRLVP